MHIIGHGSAGEILFGNAFLNNETIELEINVFCKDNMDSFLSKNLIVLNKNNPTNTYKINSNEWLKKPQEL